MQREGDNGYYRVLHHLRTNRAFLAWKTCPQKKSDGRYIKLKIMEW